MKKTAKQWLMCLKDEHRNMAIANMEEGAENDEYSCLSMALSMSCHVWRNTPQGYDFWREIFEQISSGTYFDAPQLTEESCGEAARKTMYGLPERMATDEDYDKLDELTAIFPEDDEERQKYAVGTFICEFFPHAIAELARFSYDMQQKHNPGAPMGWAKEKSVGDGNQIFRHQMDGEFREVAWRGLEQLERFLTKMEPFNNQNNENQN